MTTRTAPRMYRKPVVAGVYGLDAGAWVDGVGQVRWVRGVMDLRVDDRGRVMPRELVAVVPSVQLDGLTMRWGLARINRLTA